MQILVFVTTKQIIKEKRVLVGFQDEAIVTIKNFMDITLHAVSNKAPINTRIGDLKIGDAQTYRYNNRKGLY